MKKYEKPQIIIEHFEISQSVADCTWTMNLETDGKCTGDASDKGMSDVLFGEMQPCTLDFGVVEGMMCYYSFQEEMTLFNS